MFKHELVQQLTSQMHFGKGAAFIWVFKYAADKQKSVYGGKMHAKMFDWVTNHLFLVGAEERRGRNKAEVLLLKLK